ncbi:MAG: hypothetical protein AAB874_07250 [Patescibacteria group bacterium]
MKDLVKKVAVGLSTGALVAQSMILPAFAEITIVVNGNGSNSDPNVNVASTNTTTVNQTNTANVKNDIDAKANTGDNSADDNTGGDINIDTGEAKALVEVSNKLNSNEAQVDCGGCPADVNVEVSGNGTYSQPDVNLALTNTTWVTQDNTANVENDVEVKANSGDNDADDNTGGNTSIDTGKATAWAGVENTLNANVAHVGGSGEGALEILVNGNGSYSDPNVTLALAGTTGLVQNNFADVENDVEVKANSGKNDADDNTGGNNSIDTGDAWAGAQVDTLANFNLAHVEDCCEFDGLVKVAGNGTDSEPDVTLALVNTLYATQDNNFTCGEEKGWEHLFWGDWRSNDCDVEAKANSGKNDLDDNTGDPGSDPSIDTGKASTEVEVNNEANSNVFSTGDAFPDHPEWDMGSESNWFWWFLSGHSN